MLWGKEKRIVPSPWYFFSLAFTLSGGRNIRSASTLRCLKSLPLSSSAPLAGKLQKCSTRAHEPAGPLSFSAFAHLAKNPLFRFRRYLADPVAGADAAVATRPAAVAPPAPHAPVRHGNRRP